MIGRMLCRVGLHDWMLYESRIVSNRTHKQFDHTVSRLCLRCGRHAQLPVRYKK